MSTIRQDLIGSVIIHTDEGTVTLFAGDEIPEGVTVGEHLIHPDTPESDEPTEETEVAEATEAPKPTTRRRAK